MKPSTKIVSSSLGHQHYCDGYRAVNQPLYQTSTVLFDKLSDYHRAEEKANDLSYGIAGTPTSNGLKHLIASLYQLSKPVDNTGREDGEDGNKDDNEKSNKDFSGNVFLTPSGLFSISFTLQALLKTGDELLITDSVYSPTRRFCKNILQKNNIHTKYYHPTIDAESLGNLISENTRVIYLESPGSIMFEMQDIDAIIAVVNKINATRVADRKIITIFDNSWATALHFNPLDYGIDIVIEAITKYISGHSDILMGCVATRSCVIASHLQTAYRSFGISVSPSDCAIAIKGSKTMAVRLAHHQQSALKFIEFLKTQAIIDKILFPADSSFEGFPLWQKYFTGFASLITIVLKKQYSMEEIDKATAKMELFGKGASWGGYNSLVLDYSPGLIKSIRPVTRKAQDFCEDGSLFGKNLLRFYIGLEDIEDLIASADKGFKLL